MKRVAEETVEETEAGSEEVDSEAWEREVGLEVAMVDEVTVEGVRAAEVRVEVA